MEFTESVLNDLGWEYKEKPNIQDYNYLKDKKGHKVYYESWGNNRCLIHINGYLGKEDDKEWDLGFDPVSDFAVYLNSDELSAFYNRFNFVKENYQDISDKYDRIRKREKKE